MRRLLLPVSALTLIALIAIAGQGGDGGAAEGIATGAVAQGPPEAAAPLAPAPAPAAGDAGAAAEGGRQALAPGAGGGVAGGRGETVATVRARLVDESGRPLPGARLSVILAERDIETDHRRMLQFFEAVAGRAAPGLDRFEAFADGAGVALVELPKQASLIVAVGAEERRQAAFARIPWEHGRTAYDAGELTLNAGCALRVEVQDARGRPVAGARAVVYGDLELRADRFPFHLLTTDVEGTARFGYLPPGDLRVVVHHAQHAVAEQEVGALAAGASRRVAVTLETGDSITGVVVDSTGEAAEGVPIFVEEEEPRRGILDPLQLLLGREESTTTGAGGRFAVHGLASGKRYHVTARRSVDLEASAEGVRAGAELQLRLPAEAALRGRIVTAAGSPAAGAKVQVLPVAESRRFAGDGVHETGADGRFEALVSHGDYRVAAWHASGEERWPTIFTVRGAADAGDLRLAAGGDLELTVLAAEGGRRIGGARLREIESKRYRSDLQQMLANPGAAGNLADRGAVDRERDRVLRSGRPSAEEVAPGVYLWSGLHPGLHAFAVEAGGHPETRFEVEIHAGQRARHTVGLAAGATLVVTAKRAGGKPAKETFLSLAASDGAVLARPAFQRTDDGGVATFTGLTPGGYALYEGFTFGGDGDERLATVELVAGENVLELLLEARFDLLVRVAGAAGPVAGASVEIATVNQGFERLLRIATAGGGGDHTDENGEFLATELKAGTHTVRAARDGGYPAEAEVELLGPGQEVTVRLEGARVSGTVADAPEDCEVELKGIASRTVSTDVLNLGQEALVESLLAASSARHAATAACTPDGRFVFHDVPDGDYELVATAPRRVASEPLAVTVAGAPVIGLSLTTRAAGSVALVVGGIHGVARYRARIVDAEGGTVGAEERVRRNGRYTFDVVPEGAWTLRIEGGRRGGAPLAELAIFVSAGVETLVAWTAP